jgi:hypothetical protein
MRGIYFTESALNLEEIPSSSFAAVELEGVIPKS